MTQATFQPDALASVRQRLAAAQADQQDEYECMGRRFVVQDGVFPPTHFQSTGIFTRHLPYPRGGRFLEIGCGAGVTAVTAALEGCAVVVASDISADAVANTRANANRHGVAARMSIRQGDLFDVLEEGERFDVIFWNSNFVFVEADHVFDTAIMLAFCDPGYAAHRRFLDEAPRHLALGGMLLMGFSSQGDGQALEALLREHGYASRVIASVSGQGDGAPRYDILQLLPGAHAPAGA
ncbi:methyltransferase [Metapseudomonas otitidis]|uniref:methyltransferase n=1 Tax=Metapseudomonas otitidis TaxID=319939 RepID=UPI001F2EC270|nr:class I SAM-dependent methyltransferase [Pseudomonas otitidis]